jgi:hypothetical protein
VFRLVDEVNITGGCAMGYTHYWYGSPLEDGKVSAKVKEGWEKAVPAIQNIIKRYADILCYECDEPKRTPLVDVVMGIVHFNGKEDDGYEPFSFNLSRGNEFTFCKTAEKPYDIAVCEVLLVLKAFLPGFRLSSDGFSGNLEKAREAIKRGCGLDGDWDKVIKNVRHFYGIDYGVDIVKEREPYCDMVPVLRNARLGILDMDDNIHGEGNYAVVFIYSGVLECVHLAKNWQDANKIANELAEKYDFREEKDSLVICNCDTDEKTLVKG